jgi:hypothetical protein
MKHYTRILGALLLAGLWLTFQAPPALGHNFWIGATDFTPDFSDKRGGKTTLYFGFGHHFPLDDFLKRDKLIEFRMMRPDQTRIDLEPGKYGFLETQVSFDRPGGHVIGAATRPGYYTMFEEDGKIRHELGPLKARENVILSLYFENYAKALVKVGSTPDGAYQIPVGHALEIMAGRDPFAVEPGDILPLEVRFHGKPARYCTVSATYVGFSDDEAYCWSARTDGRGKTSLRITHQGQWLIRAEVRRPVSAQHKGKALEEKYTAFLSFSIR